MEIPIQVAVRIAPTNKSTDDGDDADDNGNKTGNTQRCCVQTIPMAAASPAAFLAGTAAPLLPGVNAVLDNGLGIAAGLVQVNGATPDGKLPTSFPVTHALPYACTQSQVYHQTVFPLISLFMEGFDASVVTYGQCGTGKSYTLFGPGFDCVYGEADQGVVQRCVREIFAHMASHPERTYAINIGWVEIYGDVIRDLLGVGNVHCNSITDVFHWLHLGLSTKVQLNAQTEESTSPQAEETIPSHSLFTLTLEQQWISKEGLIQHRLSTASFSDLCGTERRQILLNANAAAQSPQTLPSDVGLQALEQVVNTLTDPALMYGANGNIPYTQTTLTTLLKDSFGGRAQTLLILCVSPLEYDITETISNLQFAFKVQCVRNYVIMNTFSDDNTPISPEGMVRLPNDLSAGVGVGVAGVGVGMLPTMAENFGLQFAAGQWFKLVSNAEGLFSKLISSNAISELDKEQIEEWLFLKQECEECLSSSEAIRCSQKQLGPIQEIEEPVDETVDSEPETSCQQNSDNESDSESQRPDLAEKLECLMEELRLKTDALVRDKHKEFIRRQPKAVMESQESFRQQQQNELKSEILERQSDTNKLDERKASMGGRRRSIQPGASLSSAEIAMLNRVAREPKAALVPHDDLLLIDSSGEQFGVRANNNTPVDCIQKKLRKLDTDIEARQRQIKEVEQTMHLKQNIITELVKNSETRSNAKQRFHKKRAKLEAEYEKTKKQLAKALLQQTPTQGKLVPSPEVEKLRALMAHLEQRLQDLTSIKHIAGESGQKVKKLQQSLHESKKQLEELQKKLKKDRRLREQLDTELRALREKENTNKAALVKVETGALTGGPASDKHLKEVQARISHLDHVLREKSANLEQYGDSSGEISDARHEEKQGLRHEIRNLRRTRDHLLEQRCTLDRKLKRDKQLSHREERKLLECDEAIEAIDAAIEFKNELICGHKSIDTSERLQREKGEQMLMARLNRLSPEEMRTLLYKYFTKVIDLRDASRKLEVQLMQLERERDAWEWKERVLSNAVRQARLEGERNAVLLQRQHEMKLTLMLRHLAEETSASSASFSGEQQQPRNYMRAPTTVGGAGLTLATTHNNNTTTTNTTNSDSDFDLEFYKHAAHAAALKPPKHGEMEICPLPADALAKYKPLDKFKDKDRETKNKLFAKFQVLTRYAGQSVSLGGGGGAASGGTADEHHSGTVAASSKKKEHNQHVAIIPQEQLKRLNAAPPATKVTRQKNKIIIQDASRKN